MKLVPASVGDAGDVLRGLVAGRQAVAVAKAATRLFEAAGKKLLGDGTRGIVRDVAEKASSAVLGGGAGVVIREAAKRLSTATAENAEVAGVVVAQSAKAAGRQILAGAGRAAGIGFVLDGAIAGYTAVRMVRAGEETRERAVKYVAKEAFTGALATGAGVLVGAGLVAVTGPVSIPVLIIASAAGSVGTKALLRRAVG